MNIVVLQLDLKWEQPHLKSAENRKLIVWHSY
jgi:hypothetical protein